MSESDPGQSAAAHDLLLDPAEPSVSQIFVAETCEASSLKFVQVQVSAVINPRLVPLSFHVHYRALDGSESLLGTFSLFPPDNPGTFIVATSGKLQGGGEVRVTLVPLVAAADASDVRIQLMGIAFVR